MKLNLGCGTTPMKGWVNADYVDAEGVNAVFDASKRFPFGNDVFDEIYCSHTLEHIFNWPDTVSECHRVLKPGGRLTIRVPYGCSKHNPEGTHVRYFWEGSMDMFLINEGQTGVAASLDTGRYINLFRMEKRVVYRMLWYHWHIRKYLGIKKFNLWKYRFPFGYPAEIKWVLRKPKRKHDGSSSHRIAIV